WLREAGPRRRDTATAPGRLAALVDRDLAAGAPDEADDPVGVVAWRAQAVGTRVLLHEQLGVGHKLRPASRRGSDACLGELVPPVPDAAHATEPRDRVNGGADSVVGEHALTMSGL